MKKNRLLANLGTALAVMLVPVISAQTTSPGRNATSVEPKTDETTNLSRSEVTATAGTPGTAASEEEAAITLSPFEVTADEDRGYQALTTLGGTRLRTDLKDLAVSMSIVTKQFMEDVAADNLEDLAPYLLGTESGGLNGNFSDSSNNAGNGFTDFQGQLDNLTPQIRVRGLGTATRTRDYFLTDIPGDGYNVERMEIQRGPNGMLYGLGSAAGVLNDGLIRANIQRNRSRVTTRLGSYGSYRAALDHNQMLVKDKLAFRLAALYDHSEYQIEHAYETDRRVSGTVTYKPFNGTTLRVFGETALVRANPPQPRPPFDAFTYWWAAGKPVYDSFTRTASFLGEAPTGTGFTGSALQFLDTGITRGLYPQLIIEDPNTGVYGLSIPGNPQGMVLRAIRSVRNAAGTAWLDRNMYGTTSGRNYLRAANGGTSNIHNAFWRVPQMTDPTVFDFFNHQLDGPARSRSGRWKNLQVSLEQRLGKHAGIEISYDHQDLDQMIHNFLHFNAYTISLDVTTVLADGTPNPNFGRPFVAFPNQSQTFNRQRDAFRATAYYDFDFKRIIDEGSLLARILGRHTLTSNYTWQDSEVRALAGNDMLDLRYSAIANARFGGGPGDRANGFRALNVLTYLGPNLSAESSPQNQGIQGLERGTNVSTSGIANMSLYHAPVTTAASTVPGAWTLEPFDIISSGEWDIDDTAFSGSHNYSKFKAASVVLQDRWFDNTLISTLGWRRDWVYESQSGPLVFDATGRLLHDESVWPLLPKPNSTPRKDSFNYGLVLHMPQFIKRRLPQGMELSFLYNRSDNFTPAAARHNVYGQEFDPPTGETEEYGILLSLFDRKIDVRASYYDSASTLVTNGSFGSTITDMRGIAFNTLNGLKEGFWDVPPEDPGYVPENVRQAFVDFFRTPAASTFFSEAVTGFYVDANGVLQGTNSGATISETSDIATTGLELEVTANVTRNWRITANVARQESVKSNSGEALWTLLQSWRPYVVDGPAGDMPRSFGQTNILRNYFTTWEATTRRVRALDGSITPEVRKWRYNMITNYSITSGPLNGWGIGGAVRWQDKAAIGYPVILIEGAPQYDVTQPFFGPAETNTDAWLSYSKRISNDKVRWRAQLNVRNIGKKDELIPVSTQPDGTIDAYRIGANMTWALTNTFEF